VQKTLDKYGEISIMDQRTRGPEDQRTRGPEDQRTRGPEDQRTRGPEDRLKLFFFPFFRSRNQKPFLTLAFEPAGAQGCACGNERGR
jgi:hypothetical protein